MKIMITILIALLFLGCNPDNSQNKKESDEENAVGDKQENIQKNDAESTSGTFEFLVVTEGIVGGFAPANVRWKLIVDLHDGEYRAHLMKLDQEGKEVYLTGKLDKEKSQKMLSDINVLFDLPLEDPVGSEDIYQMDTSIHLHFSNKFWVNRAPAVRHGQSTVKVEGKHMEKFGKSGLTIRETVENSELLPSTKEDFDKIIEMYKPFSYRVGNY